MVGQNVVLVWNLSGYSWLARPVVDEALLLATLWWQRFMIDKGGGPT